MTNQPPLIGSWKLLSAYGESTEGDRFVPYGEEPLGMLIYTQEGTMSVTLMALGRPKFASGDIYNATPEELKAAFENFDAYCGTYTLEVGENKVTHHLEASRFPNWEGSNQVRYFQLEGNKLSLYTDPIASRGTTWILYLEWERL